MEPLLDGDKNPNNANTVQMSGQVYQNTLVRQTQRDTRHSAQLCAISHKYRKHQRIPRRAEYLPVDQLPTEIFLNVLLGYRET